MRVPRDVAHEARQDRHLDAPRRAERAAELVRDDSGDDVAHCSTQSAAHNLHLRGALRARGAGAAGAAGARARGDAPFQAAKLPYFQRSVSLNGWLSRCLRRGSPTRADGGGGTPGASK